MKIFNSITFLLLGFIILFSGCVVKETSTEVVKTPDLSKLQDIAKSPYEEMRKDIFAKDDDDWEIIESGGDPFGGRTTSPNPSQCVCGRAWDVDLKQTIFNNRPNAADVTNCYNAINFPANPQDCDDPCIAITESNLQYYIIDKNQNTGKFRLFCSKRTQWHCERVEG